MNHEPHASGRSTAGAARAASAASEVGAVPVWMLKNLYEIFNNGIKALIHV